MKSSTYPSENVETTDYYCNPIFSSFWELPMAPAFQPGDIQSLLVKGVVCSQMQYFSPS